MQPQITAVARPGDTIAIESPTYFGLCTEARFVVARTGQRNDLGPRYHGNLANVGSELSLTD